MVDLILKQNLSAKKYDTTYSPNVYFPKSDFDKALDIAVKNSYTEIAQSFKPHMILRHRKNYVFEHTEGCVTNFLKIMYPNPKEALMVDHSGNNLIHIATSFGLDTPNGGTKTVKHFIENTEALTARNNYGHTPLYRAMINYHFDIFCIIIKAVPEDHILKPIKNGKNIIHIAAEIGQLDFVSQLCQKVKNPMVLDVKGNSPIHHAASKGQLQILQMLQKVLKSYWTDMTIPNGNGKTPLQLAKLNGHSKVVKYLSQF